MVVVAPLEADRYRLVSNTQNALEALPLPMEVVKVRRERTFNLSIRQAYQYSHGRVFLAGDAAHCHSPVGGRGMNLGIADAAELAVRMAEDRLAGYSASRHAIGARIIAGSERMRKLITSTNPIVRGSFGGAARIASRIPQIRKRIARRLILPQF